MVFNKKKTTTPQSLRFNLEKTISIGRGYTTHICLSAVTLDGLKKEALSNYWFMFFEPSGINIKYAGVELVVDSKLPDGIFKDISYEWKFQQELIKDPQKYKI